MARDDTALVLAVGGGGLLLWTLLRNRGEHAATTSPRGAIMISAGQPEPVSSPADVDPEPVSSPAALDPDPEPVSSPDQLDQAGGSFAPAEPIDPYPDLAPTAPTTPAPTLSPPSAPPAAPAPPRPPPAAPRTATGLSRRFDDLLNRYRGSVPIEYLRALIDRESGTDPKNVTRSARGLMQIIPVVRDDYNKRHGSHYQAADLFDPAINVAMGCELLSIIITSYAIHHSRIPNLQVDWENPRYVELLTYGWNTGYSEAGGVGRVATYLERHGITDLTIDLVRRTAPAAGASKYLASDVSVRWCKSVAVLYQRERAAAAQPALQPTS